MSIHPHSPFDLRRYPIPAIVFILGLLLLFFGSGVPPARAQGGVVGQPWTGRPGITETVAQMMERQRHTPPATPAPARPYLQYTGPLIASPDSLPVGMPTPSAARSPIRLAPQTVGTGFNGTTYATDSFVIPPDTMGAVGPDQVLFVNNGRVKVFDKTGTVGGLNVTSDVFFASVRTAGTTDPHVRYDRLSQRWFINMIDDAANSNRVLIAVSSGPHISNSSSFTLYGFQFDTSGGGSADNGKFCDYPSLGVDASALYIGCNIFTSSTGTFASTTGFVVRKSDLLSGTLTVTTFRLLADNSVGPGGVYSPQGVDNEDPNATEGYIIGPTFATSGSLTLRRVSTPGGTPSISGNLNITGIATANPASQPAKSSSPDLDTGDRRLYGASIHKNKISGASTLWTAETDRMNSTCTGVYGGSGQGNNGTLWYELNNLTTTPAVAQSGIVCDPANTNYGFIYGSVAESGQGHMAIGATYASKNVYAGIAVVGRLRTDTAGSTQAFSLPVAGVNSYTLTDGAGQNRWGDFSQTVVDPNDDQTIWTFQEYASGINTWSVRAVQLIAPPPAAITTVSPTYVGLGLSSTNVIITGTSSSGSEFFDPGPDTGGPGYANRLVVTLSKAGNTVPVSSVIFTDPTHVTATISTVGVSAGVYDVAVTNPDGQVVTATNAITVGLKVWGGGGSTNNWSEAGNWLPSGAPSTTDQATFNSTSVKNATVDVNPNVYGVNIATGYTGIISLGANTLTASKTYTQTTGTFNAGSGTLNVGADMAVTGGTFTQGTSTVTLNGSTAQKLTAPPAFNNLTINNASGVTLQTNATAVNGTLTLSNGALANGALLTMGNGATISRGSGSLGAAPTFGTSVNLVYTAGVTTGVEVPASTTVLNNLTINASAATVTLGGNPTVNGLLLLSNGTLSLSSNTITLKGGLTNNASSTALNGATGKVVFSTNNQSVSGSAATTFNDVDTTVGVDFNTGATTATIGGVLTLNSGGFVNGVHPPLYGASSTLKYNTGGTYNRFNEWTTATSGAGYPNSVQVSNNTTLNYPNGSTAARSMGGNLTIDSGSALYMDFGSPGVSNPLTVGGNVAMSGNLSLGDAAGGDLKVGGNWTHTAGTLNDHTRAVWFNGSGTQTLSATGGETLSYVIVNKSANNLQLLSNLTVSGATSDVLQLLSGPGIDVNGQTLTLSGAGGNIKLNAGTRTITGAAGSTVLLSGAKTVTNGGTLTLDTNVLVKLNAAVDFGASLTTIKGTLQVNGGGSVNTNPPSYAVGSLLQYNCACTYGRATEWTTATSGPGYPANVQVSNNSTLNYPNGSTAAHSLSGNLTVDAGSSFFMDYGSPSPAVTNPLNVGGSVTLNGALSLGNGVGGDLNVGGSWTRNTGSNFYPNSRAVTFNGTSAQTIGGTTTTTFDYVTFGDAAGVTLNQAITATQLLQLNSGAGLAGGSQTVTLGGDWTDNGGTFTPGTSTAVFAKSGAANLSMSATNGVEPFYNLTVNSSTTLNTGDDAAAASNALANYGVMMRSAPAQNVTTGGGAVLYTDADNRTTVRLTSTGGSNPGSTTVTSTAHAAPGTCGGSSVTTPVLRYYNITPTNLAGIAATLRLYYFQSGTAGLDEMNGNAVNAISIYHCNGTTWQILAGPYGTAYDPAVGMYYTEVANVTSFSPFALGPGSPTAVTLGGFSAAWQGTRVQVQWNTLSEINNLGFNLLRSTSATGPFTQINARLIPGCAGCSTGQSYSYADANVTANTTYYYKLAAMDKSGATQLFGPVTVAPACANIPAQSALNGPANGAVLATLHPTLQWSALTCAARYEVQVRQGSASGPLVAQPKNLTSAQFAPAGLTAGKSYVWRVRACNAAGCGAWSGWWQFSVATGAVGLDLYPKMRYPVAMWLGLF
ncbi:MAG: hypothetical protein WCF84_21540 [Anaerolineae bacterium]